MLTNVDYFLSRTQYNKGYNTLVCPVMNYILYILCGKTLGEYCDLYITIFYQMKVKIYNYNILTFLLICFNTLYDMCI